MQGFLTIVGIMAAAGAIIVAVLGVMTEQFNPVLGFFLGLGIGAVVGVVAALIAYIRG